MITDLFVKEAEYYVFEKKTFLESSGTVEKLLGLGLKIPLRTYYTTLFIYENSW